jgi:UDP-N-acetylglucosamine--N-acetylmuramyl-(pentapeptide) pyrophosphoryl-undecaprenol N-acetylglucosamine transferase
VHDGPVVVVTGGGTGGHLYPALAIADALRAERPDVRVLFVGAARGLEARVLPARNEWHVLLPIRGADRGGALSTALAATRVVPDIVRSLVRVAKLFARERPEVVVVTGGYAAAPAGFVAGLSGIPLALQEQNSVPGVVTRVLSRWASRAYVAFPEVADQLPAIAARTRVTGNPVRAGAGLPRDRARSLFGIPTDARLMIVAGGSQGSLALNDLLGDALAAVGRGELHRPARLHILWVTGPRHVETVRDGVAAHGSPDWVHTVPYVDDFPSALAAADMAVSRAGAMSTAELLLHGLPSVLVPLPTAAADHQTHNARSLERAGAAIVAPQAGLTGAELWSIIAELLASPPRLEAMRRAALALARPSAAADIASDVATLLSPLQSPPLQSPP